MDRRYNTKSPAVKRLMREAAELSTPAHEYYAAPLEDNLFEWHFTVRGPEDTEFQGGVYHGRILIPSEYPMKPPDIILLTPNGRFEVGKKICLSISGYHPETWQPSWSIRTALLAIIGFMPTVAKSYEVGAIAYPAEERKKLANQSLNWRCDTCDTIPSKLLASSDHKEKNIDQAEVDEIVNKFQLKGENEGSKKQSSPPDVKSQDTNPSQEETNSSSTSAQQSPQPDLSELPSPSREPETSSQNVSSNQQSSEMEEASSWFGFQLTDGAIAVLILLLAFLIYRRFSGQAYQFLGTSRGDDLT